MVDTFTIDELLGHAGDPNTYSAGTSFNLLPVLTVTGTTTNPVEQGAAVDLTAGNATSITDADNDHLASATVQITGGTFTAPPSNESSANDDHLFVLDGVTQRTSGLFTGTNITVTYTSATETLTLTGYDTLANYQVVLNAVHYFTTGDNPTNYGSNPTRTITWTVSDGAPNVPSGGQNSTTTVITIVAVNDAPVNTVAAHTVTEDTAKAILFSVSDVDAAPTSQNITVRVQVVNGTIDVSTIVAGGVTAGQVTGDNTNNALLTATQNQINATFANATGVLYRNTPDYNGPDTLTVTSNDLGRTGTDPGTSGDGSSEQDADAVAITVNAVVDIAADAITTLEDNPITANVIAGTNGASPDSFENSGRSLTSVTQSVKGFLVTFAADGMVTYTPGPDFNGGDSFDYTVTSGGVTETATATVTVTPVNDAPTLDPIANVSIPEDSGVQTIPLGGITAGPLETQTLSVNASSNKPAIIPNPPVTYTTADLTGSLSYTPVANAFGSAIITVNVFDNGGTGNGGVNTFSRTFTVTVDPVTDPPSVSPATTFVDVQTTSGLVVERNVVDGPEVTHFKISNVTNGTLFQQDGTTPIATSAGNQFITYAQGTAGLKFTPASGFTGTASFEAQAAPDDSGAGLSPATTATITVNPYPTTTTITADAPDASERHQVVTVAYTVVSAAGGPTPTGNVVVTIGGGPETCTGTVAAGSCPITLTEAGVDRVITASYQGDSVSASSSDTELHTVNTCVESPVVTTNADSGAGSLRQAIASACIGTTITFNMTPGNVVSPIALTGSALTLTRHVTISGPGANVLTVQRTSGAGRLFTVDPGVTAEIAGLTVTGGNASGVATAGAGGAIYNDRGTLTLTGMTISGNSANVTGGAIANSGDAATAALTISNSTISGNTVNGTGGALHNTGFNGGSAPLTMSNSTISGNTATGDGGGLYLDGSGAITIVNATITNNRADNDTSGAGDGGGLKIAGADATLHNSIVTGNFVGGSPSTTADDFHGTMNAGSANNLLTGDARLAALATNGGPTETHALLFDSPALDAGNNAHATATDQRGAPRVRDAADANATQTVDLGAFEADPAIEDITDKETPEDTPLQFAINVGDGATAFTSHTLTSSNATLVPNNLASLDLSAVTGSTRTLTINPALNQFGSTTITVRLTRTIGGVPVFMEDSFLLTVTSVNDQPTLDPIADPLAILEDAGEQTVNLTGISAGGGETQTLFVTPSSGNDGVIPHPTPTYASPNATGSIAYTPVANAHGTAVITVAVTDDGTPPQQFQRTFNVVVNPVADTPSVTNATTNEDTQTTSGLVISRNVADGAEVDASSRSPASPTARCTRPTAPRRSTTATSSRSRRPTPG